jgi:hypothetical protein
MTPLRPDPVATPLRSGAEDVPRDTRASVAATDPRKKGRPSNSRRAGTAGPQCLPDAMPEGGNVDRPGRQGRRHRGGPALPRGP